MHYPGLRAGNGERGTEEELVGAIGGAAAANQQHFSSEARDLEELAWNDTWMMTNLPEQSTDGKPEADTWTTMGASHGNASLADFESWSESGSSGRATTGTILPVVSESSYFSDAPANLMSDEPGAYYDLAPPSDDAGSSSDSGTFFTESSAVGSSTEASDNESESMCWDDEAFNPYVDPFLSVNEQQVLRPPVHETTRHPLGALPPAELSTAALPLGWGVGATGMDERALDREASTGSSIASHPAAATKKEIMVALPSQVAAPLAVSVPLTATEATAATTDKADQIKYALEHIIERPTSREQRQQVWKWAEMLLATDDVEFMRRPRIMPHPFGVYREDSPSTRRSRKSDTDVPDKWQNSGGLRGGTLWPLDGTVPRLRCQYGKVVPQGQQGGPPPATAEVIRYQMYTFTTAGAVANSGQASAKLESRKLFVVFSSSDQASDTTTQHLPVGHPAVHLGQQQNSVEVDRIHSMVSELEHQVQLGSRHLEVESVVKLLTLLSELPQDEQDLIERQYERPVALVYPPPRYVFVEIASGKRRAMARKHGKQRNSAGHDDRLSFDKWLNGGGKRAIVDIPESSLQRRAGRIDRAELAGGFDDESKIDLRYLQYTLKTAPATGPEGARHIMPAIYQVTDRSRASSKLAAAVSQAKKPGRKAKGGQTVSKKRPEETLLTLDGDHLPKRPPKRRKKNTKSSALAGLTVLAVVLYLGAVHTFGGTPSSFDLGGCAPGFFLSASGLEKEVTRECFPRADHTICDEYEEAMSLDAGAGSELACVESCASMGTDACDAISYNSRSTECKAFRSCARTVNDPNTIGVLSWTMVWLRAADQPAPQPPASTYGGQAGAQWGISCYALTSRVSKQPMDSRCLRCDDCGGDYNILLPCTSTANAVCFPREESWDLVTDATISAGNLSQGLELLSPPLYAATWQTDAAIYAFGGSEPYWSDDVPDRVPQQYTNSLWKLDRSRAPHVLPRWTRIRSGGTPQVDPFLRSMKNSAEQLWPAGRAAAACWAVGRDSGMIFSGQFDLTVNAPDLEALPGSFFVPPNSIFRFDTMGAHWRLLGGVDTWQMLQSTELAEAFSNGFLEKTSTAVASNGEPPAFRRWPLPRSHTQTFSLSGAAYMFSGLFQIVDATTLGPENESSGRRSSSAQTRSFLLNDFWVLDANADYEANRIPVAILIAKCATVVERPEILPRGSAYPGPRRGAATWSASIDDQLRTEHEGAWLELGWMFGGIGRRISTSGTATPSPVGITKPRTGGAYSCVAEQLSDDGKSSPEVAVVTNLCDLWSFTRRSGWVVVHACARDAGLLYRAGVTSVAQMFGTTQNMPMEGWAQIPGPSASVLSTTWVEYDWQWTNDALRGAPNGKHAETFLRMCGGVTSCAARRPLVRDSNGTTEHLNFSHQLVAHTMCDVLDENTAAGFEPLAPAQCSSDLWTFSTTTHAWTRTVAPASTDSAAAGNDEDRIRWPPAHCGAYSISGPIPPWYSATTAYAHNLPLIPRQVDDYQAAEGVNLRGRSSILLAGGWNGSATSNCIHDPTSTPERARGPTAQDSLNPMGSPDVMNPTGNESHKLPAAKCFSATEMWRWEAARSSITAP